MNPILKFLNLLKASLPFVTVDYVRQFPHHPLPYPFPEKYLEVDSKRICYIQAGKGRPLVFLHGSLDSIAIWQKNIPELAQHFTVYALDFPGFGKSEREIEDVSVGRLTKDLHLFLQKLDIREPILIGCSMGGHVALNYAITHQNVSHLALVSPGGIAEHGKLACWIIRNLFTPQWMAAFLYRYAFKLIWNQQFYKPNEETDEIAKRCLFYRQVPDAKERLRFVKTFVENIQTVVLDHVLGQAQKLQSPTLLLWGDHDHYHPIKYGRQLLGRIPHAQLEILKNSGHLAMIESAEEFNRIVIKFLTSKEVC